MSNTFQYDGSVSAEQEQAVEADHQESLQIGNALEQEQQNLLAGKYKSAEELEKGYLELQKMVSQNQPSETSQPESTVSDKLAEAFESYNSEKKFNADAFEDISKEDLIKAFFENSEEVPQQGNDEADLTQSQVDDLMNRVGGKDQYRQIMDWAVKNLPKNDMETFDSIVSQANSSQIAMAVDAVAKRFADANGHEGVTLQGRAAANNNVYRSQAELLREMNDPRYDSDPAYRNDVMTKLANSPDLQF